MATTETTHALDLPEICALIATHLTKTQLGECILVSHRWADTFRPLFWRTRLVPRHKVALCRDEDLARHGHHIRILSAGRIQQTSPFDQASVAYLQHLEVSTCGSNDEPDNGLGCLPAIVHRNKASLSEFHWMCFGRDLKLNKPFRIWPEVFLGLERLETVVLSKWSMAIDDFLTILKACPSLNTLTFEATEDLEDPSPPPSNSSNANSSSNRSKQWSKGMDTSQDPPLFQHHGVHTVHYNGNAMPGYLQHLPNVHTLHLQNLTHGNLSTIPDEIRQFCPEIASLHTLTPCSNPSRFLSLVDSIHTLRSFQGRVPSEAMQDFLEMVLAKHAETIETLCLTEAESDGLRFNVWRFLENCPRLADFQIPYKLEGSLLEATTTTVPTGFTSSYFSSPRFSRRRPYEPTKPWVCQDLSKLWLRIKDMDIQLMESITTDLCLDRLMPPMEKVAKASSSGSSSSQYQQQHQQQGRVLSVGSLVGHHAHHRHGHGHGYGGARAHSPLERLIVEKLSGLRKLSKINIGSGWYELPDMKD
ncbi:MAG: hypothetical protein BYD32DRAFT_431656 [Podila humilis]|nr:MAG: hypothetical protein BYD32DRAFT_431656 [Podila humilis]